MEDGLATAGYCGLFCESCSFYVASLDEEKLAQKAKETGKTVDEVRCKGCRSDTVTFYCRTCSLMLCAKGRGVGFCSECGEYPCGALKEFQAARPHRLELFASLDYAKENGLKAWREKMEKAYSCEKCGTINSIYEFSCRNCGNEPSNPYVGRNIEKIKEML
jgi:hypothetical protein